jgi:hypothetical protein
LFLLLRLFLTLHRMMVALCETQLIPLAGELRLSCTQLTGCQHFDFGSMKVHCFLDFTDVLEAVLEALDSSFLSGLFLLPGGSRARHGKEARSPGLTLLQSGQLGVQARLVELIKSIPENEEPIQDLSKSLYIPTNFKPRI